MPTKTSPPCGLAGFKRGFAGVGRCGGQIGGGSNRWGLNVLVDWVIGFFWRFNSSVFFLQKTPQKKGCAPGRVPPQEANAQESGTDGAVRGLDERWA